MTPDLKKFCLSVMLALAAIIFSQSPAGAQTMESRPAQTPARPGGAAVRENGSNTQAASKGESREADQIDELKAKIEQLQMLVERQQRALAEMEGRLQKVEEKDKAAATVSASSKRDAVTDAALRSESEATVAEPLPENGSPTSGGAAKAQEKPGLIAGWDKDGHAFIRSADGNFETNIAGYGHFDFRGYQSGDHPPNTFLIRRARLGVEGKLYRYFDYKIQAEFADSNGTSLRDLFVNFHRTDKFQLRFGQFKEPFSQEQLLPATSLDFVERSLANALAPDRSPGIMASGVFNKGVFEYQVGAFNGKGLGNLNDNGTPETVARLRFAPWKKGQSFWAKGLAFGGAYAQGRGQVGESVRGQTESRSFTFFNPVPIKGKTTRANGEMAWLLGPASLRAEYIQTNEERDNLGPGGTNLPGVVAKGYMAQFTYMLTGETKLDGKPINPKRNLFDRENGKTGFGAWELKVRYSNLQIADATPNSNRAGSVYFGANWYLNSFVKYQLDFGFEQFEDLLRTPNPGDRNFFVVLSRVQLAF